MALVVVYAMDPFSRRRWTTGWIGPLVKHVWNVAMYVLCHKHKSLPLWTLAKELHGVPNG